MESGKGRLDPRVLLSFFRQCAKSIAERWTSTLPSHSPVHHLEGGGCRSPERFRIGVKLRHRIYPRRTVRDAEQRGREEETEGTDSELSTEHGEEREEGRIRAPTGVGALRIRPAFAGRRIGSLGLQAREPNTVRPDAHRAAYSALGSHPCAPAPLRESSSVLRLPSSVLPPSPLGASDCPP